MGFAHEGEVRLLKYDEPHYLRLAAALMDGSPPPLEAPEHVFLDWSATAVIESILISPYSDKAYEGRVRDEIASIDPGLMDTIELSVLCERRYAPQF